MGITTYSPFHVCSLALQQISFSCWQKDQIEDLLSCFHKVLAFFLAAGSKQAMQNKFCIQILQSQAEKNQTSISLLFPLLGYVDLQV